MSINNSYSKIPLAAILQTIPRSGLKWFLFHFYGRAMSPLGMSVPEFEEFVHSSPGGIEMNWDELAALANGIIETYDCLVVAASPSMRPQKSDILQNNYTDCQIVINGFDSTDWTISAQDEQLLGKIATAFQNG